MPTRGRDIHDIRRDMINYSWTYSILDFLFAMYVNVQDLDNFKILIVNDGLEEARRILADNLNDFRKEVKTPSALKDLPRDDFATCLVPEDINQAKVQCLFTLKTTPNGDCLFNAASASLWERIGYNVIAPVSCWRINFRCSILR